MLREKIFKHNIIRCKNTSGYERLKHLELLIYGVTPFYNPPVSHAPSRISDARWQVYPFHTFITTLKHCDSYTCTIICTARSITWYTYSVYIRAYVCVWTHLDSWIINLLLSCFLSFHCLTCLMICAEQALPFFFSHNLFS